MSKKKSVKINNSSSVLYLILGFLVIVLPLFFLPQTIDLVLMPRLFLLNFFLLVFFSYFLVAHKFTKIDVSLLRNRIFPLFAALAVLTFASQFWAVNFAEGFFDTVKTFTVLLLIYVLTRIFIKNNNWHLWLSYFVVVAALISSLIGYYEYLTEIVGNSNQFLEGKVPLIYSVTGFMAHKNQFSIALMLQLPFVVFGIINFKNGWRYYSILAAAMLFVLIALLETRSVWIAVFFSTILLWILLLVYYKEFKIEKKQQRVLLNVLIGGIITAAGLFAIGSAKGVAVVEKIKSITNPQYQTNAFRLKVWSFTFDMAMERPLTGFGAGNWKIQGPRFHKGAGLKISESNWLRPHNDFLWVLAEKGFPGLLLFVSIFVFAFYYSFKIVKSELKTDVKLFVLLMMGGLAAYLVVSFFTFPLERINHQVYLSLFISSVIALHHQAYPADPLEISKSKLLLPALLLTAFGVVYGYQMIKLETHIKKAVNAREHAQWEEVIAESQMGKSFFRNLDPEATPVVWYAGTASNELGKYRQAEIFLKEASQANPYNPVVINNLSQSYINNGKIDAAVIELEKVLDIYPYFPEAMVNLSTCYYQLGKYQQSLTLLKKLRHPYRTEAVKGNIKALQEILKAKRAERQLNGENMNDSKQKKIRKERMEKNKMKAKKPKREKNKAPGK